MKRLPLLSLLCFIPILAGAQDRTTPTSLLPDIDPQDIEIRGEFRARFPGLNRQPILGFNPTPRVFRLDPNRMPFIENPDQVVATVQVAQLEAPLGPAPQYIRFPEQGYLHSRLGIGRYISPEADIYAGLPVTENTWLRGSLNHHSSDGHRNRDVQPSSFRFLDATAGIQTRLSNRTKLGFDFSLISDFNYGVAASNPNGPGAPELPGNPRKTYNGYSAGTDFTHFFNAFRKFEGDFSYNYYKVNYNFPVIDQARTEEQRVKGSLYYQWPGASIGTIFGIGAFTDAARLSGSIQDDTNWHISGVKASYEQPLSSNMKLSLIARAYVTFDEKDGNNFYLYPDARIEFSSIPNLTLVGRLGGYIVNDGLRELHETNRFVAEGQGLINRRTVFGLGEARYDFLGSAQVYAGLAYYIYENYLYFEDFQNFGNSLFGTVYDDDTRRQKLYGGIRYINRPYGFTFFTETYVQNTKLDSGIEAPYAEKFGVKAGMTLRPARNFNITIWSDYIGARPYNGDGNKLAGYYLPGGRIEYRFTDDFGLYLKVNNILDQEYDIWNGYTERLFQVYGGVTLKL
ncbi:MAG: hypothetical protein EA364_01815 [Balneolaceae bacterium]|nr:MAG: hypothetical protein EA364_01815 [Balneolaceae bacterium]